MTRSTDSRRARNSASLTIGARRRPASRPSRRRCFLASRRVDPPMLVISSSGLRCLRARGRCCPESSPEPPESSPGATTAPAAARAHRCRPRTLRALGACGLVVLRRRRSRSLVASSPSRAAVGRAPATTSTAAAPATRAALAASPDSSESSWSSASGSSATGVLVRGRLLLRALFGAWRPAPSALGALVAGLAPLRSSAAAALLGGPLPWRRLLLGRLEQHHRAPQARPSRVLGVSPSAGVSARRRRRSSCGPPPSSWASAGASSRHVGRPVAARVGTPRRPWRPWRSSWRWSSSPRSSWRRPSWPRSSSRRPSSRAAPRRSPELVHGA